MLGSTSKMKIKWHTMLWASQQNLKCSAHPPSQTKSRKQNLTWTCTCTPFYYCSYTQIGIHDYLLRLLAKLLPASSAAVNLEISSLDINFQPLSWMCLTTGICRERKRVSQLNSLPQTEKWRWDGKLTLFAPKNMTAAIKKQGCDWLTGLASWRHI